MIPRRPYLLRAFYDWLIDNHLTPYLMVDATSEDVIVPRESVQDGQIILNIAPSVVFDLSLTNKEVCFDAYFSSVPFSIVIPISSVLAIYAQENGLGTLFEVEIFESAEVQISHHFLNLVDTSINTEKNTEEALGVKRKIHSHRKKSKSQPPTLRIIK
ncbi:ClpXP protease specificity-enhancing factor [Candidatus Williamhamiltonella defendens]|uniref:ClpXP protease specificity-enhancing factor n=1 Tax=Candidatus Williamhamiltonella defendens TaxID=138072 RepID=UPI001F275F05|nr:ClpXP protease specificity-enhancing factor [Candidatus Hamiltonella defensa]